MSIAIKTLSLNHQLSHSPDEKLENEIFRSVVMQDQITEQTFTKIKFESDDGLMEILPNHEQYVVVLQPGIVSATSSSGQEFKFHLTSRGVLNFYNNTIEVITPEIIVYA